MQVFIALPAAPDTRQTGLYTRSSQALEGKQTTFTIA
jgi:hypothetical protein